MSENLAAVRKVSAKCSNQKTNCLLLT